MNPEFGGKARELGMTIFSAFFRTLLSPVAARFPNALASPIEPRKRIHSGEVLNLC
jgi:hypothetical protein